MVRQLITIRCCVARGNGATPPTAARPKAEAIWAGNVAFVALFRLRQFVIRDRRNVKRNSHSADAKTSPGQDWPAPSPGAPAP